MSEDKNHGEPKNPLSLNLYTYCWNSPILYVDYSGYGPILKMLVKALNITIDIKLRTQTFNLLNSTNVGAACLMMNKDDVGNYHASFNCWQALFGYNDFYDFVFEECSSALPKKFDCEYDGEKYRLWAWKGDYINLGASAELGVYRKIDDINGLEINHWVVDKDLAMPMTLTLTDTSGNVIVDNYSPEENQWWITGFNPKYQNMDASKLIATYTVDFTGREELYEAFKNNYPENENIIFDNVNHIVKITF